MIRFLRYAIDHNTKIKAVYIDHGMIVQKTVEVLCYDNETVTLRAGRGKAFQLPLHDLLGCSYARGDKGGEDL